MVLGERVGLPIGDVALASEDLEIEVEHLVKLAMPIVDQAGRHHHKGALQFTPAGELSKDQRGLDRLAEADFVSDQVPAGRRCCYAMRQDDLVRQKVDTRGRKGGRALHERQRVGLVGKPRLAHTLWATRDRAKDALSARLLKLERRQRNTSFSTREERAHISVSRRLDDNALTKLCVADPLAWSEFGDLLHQDSLG